MSFFFLILISIFSTQSIFAQQKIDKSFYGGLFYLTNYMTSDEYKLFLHTHNDLETVDHIYEKALTFF